MPCPDGQTAKNLTLETMEKMHCDNSSDGFLCFINKEALF